MSIATHPTHDSMVSQALFTWATRLLTGEQGYGFAAVSPALQNEEVWLEAATRMITPFTGSYELTPDQRAAYKPIGRAVVGGRALTYRKVSAGLDGHGRPGRYLIHFLVSSKITLKLSDLIYIPEDIWLNANQVQLDHHVNLRDIDVQQLRLEHSHLDLSEVKRPQIEEMIIRLAEEGKLELDFSARATLVTLFACLPPAANVIAELATLWTPSGSRLLVTVDPIEDLQIGIPAATELLAEPLQDLRQGLSSAAHVAECGHILTGRGLTPREPSHEAADSEKPELPKLLRLWLSKSDRGLTSAESRVVERDGHLSLTIMARDGLTLPDGRRIDETARIIVSQCSAVDQWRTVYVAMPRNDDAVAMYAATLPVPSVMLAICHINTLENRRVEVKVRTKIADDTIRAVLSAAREDDTVYAGLVRTLQISGYGEGSFVRRMVTSPATDIDFLYRNIVPDAFGNSNGALLGVASIAPAQLLAWLDCPEPYASALSATLVDDTRLAVWHKVSQLLGRWRPGK